MKIIFEEGRDNGYLEYFAISQLEKYKGKIYDELLWANIVPGMITGQLDAFQVVWEDDWQNKLIFTTLAEAKDHIIRHWSKHSPHVNGVSFEE